jgi:hypothetical protein
MVLIYANPRNWEHPMFLHQDATVSETDQAEMLSKFEQMLEDTGASGERQSAFALAAPTEAKLVSAKSGQLLVTDGPFAEAKEFLAGTFIFECESLERAVEIAGRFPDIRFGTVEVRPIVEL